MKDTNKQTGERKFFDFEVPFVSKDTIREYISELNESIANAQRVRQSKGITKTHSNTLARVIFERQEVVRKLEKMIS